MYSAVTTWEGGDLFKSTGPGGDVLMDTGNDDKQAQSPMQLILSAVSGCASVDVVEVMKKKRRDVSGLRVEVSADRREAFPRIFTHIRLHFVLISSDAKDKELEQAVTLSMDKYCSVSGMLKPAAEISYTWAVETP